MHVTHGDDGLWRATLETADQHEEPESNIAALVAAAESLTEADRLIWFGCSRREFNIGYECGTEPGAFSQTLSAELLAGMAALHASLGLTLYPSQTIAEE